VWRAIRGFRPISDDPHGSARIRSGSDLSVLGTVPTGLASSPRRLQVRTDHRAAAPERGPSACWPGIASVGGANGSAEGSRIPQGTPRGRRRRGPSIRCPGAIG
jgi:hypothetical protein